jgi:hypothetical protein
MNMKQYNNVITMGSAIIDLYMDGYDEGKNDEVQIDVRPAATKKKSAKERASSRRKKAHFKAEKRMSQLINIGKYEPDEDCKKVVHGMLRSHQLPLDSTYEQTFGCSIGNKKRQDTAEQKLAEAFLDEETCTV